MAKPPEEMEASMIANMEEKTGKSLAAWLKVAKSSKLTRHGELTGLLKSEHGMTHGYANLVAHKALKSDAGSAESGDALIDAQYAGPKAELRPIYDKLAAAIKKLGGDVEFAPKNAYVSVRRSKQFAIIQPSTKTRLDVGINLKGVAPAGRLEASGRFNAMVSHRVRISIASEIDAELLGWLKQAYASA
jgi:hypothetical protein